MDFDDSIVLMENQKRRRLNAIESESENEENVPPVSTNVIYTVRTNDVNVHNEPQSSKSDAANGQQKKHRRKRRNFSNIENQYGMLSFLFIAYYFLFNIFLSALTKQQLNEKNANGQLSFKFRISKSTESAKPPFKTNPEENRIKSNVWELFQMIIDETTEEKSVVSNHVRCSSCSKFFAYNGETTTSLLRHSSCGKQHSSLFKFLVNKKPTEFNKIDLNNVREAAMKFVVKDRRPYYAIEGDGLIDLCKAMIDIGRKYPNMSNEDFARVIPSRQTIANDVIKKAEEVVQMISKDFRKTLTYPGGFACTGDLWTDNYRRESYLTITAHLNLFEENTVVPKMYIINLNSIDEEQKTGKVVFDEIKRVFMKFGVSEDELMKKIVFVTDRGGNMRVALENGERISCFAHIINNIVQYMCKFDMVKDIISKGASLVRYVKITGQNENVNFKTSLKSYCETRFNTVADMLDSIECNYNEILMMLSEKQQKTKQTNLVQKLTCLDQFELKAICEFLKPFAELTTQIEGDKYSTIHRTWPAFRSIEKHLLSNASDILVIKRMKEEARKYIELNRTKIEPKLVHKISVFLHSLLKNLNFIDCDEKKQVESYARALVGIEFNSNLDENENSILNSEPIEANKSIKNNSSLFEDFLNVNEDECSDTTETDEVKRYIDFKITKVYCIHCSFNISSSSYKFCFIVTRSLKSMHSM